MKNKGQTTILFSLMISVLLLFTLTALEVGRIYMSRVKTRALVHSTCLNLMADYNSALFERYHLLFMDPTYGTGSEAAIEEKINDYLESSLNGERGNPIYQFTIEEIAIADQTYILDHNMEALKSQILNYEKTEGVVHAAKKLTGDRSADIERAASETEHNGIEMPTTEAAAEPDTEGKEEADEDSDKETEKKEKVSDPRDTLDGNLKNGLLYFLLPEDTTISKETHSLEKAPSQTYRDQKQEEKDNSFRDIGFLKTFIKNAASEEGDYGLMKQAAFVDYVNNLFSNGVNGREDSVMQCEVEYILEGKESDYDNLEAVVGDIVWMRMPINYAYLLTDETKKEEALTLAAAICIATGTESLMEIVKYLLLGCWSYAETLYEMRMLLSGETIPYVKSSETWYTDLKTLSGNATGSKVQNGMEYEDYLLLLLAKKGNKKRDLCYARILDVIEMNLNREDADFHIANCVSGMTVQGKICLNPLLAGEGKKEDYDFFFEESFTYE